MEIIIKKSEEKLIEKQQKSMKHKIGSLKKATELINL